jgi:S-adenosylmethionine hydrolase
MSEKFTIEEIRNYIQSQDSFGDVLYNLSKEKIEEANKPKEYCEECECELSEDDIGLYNGFCETCYDNLYPF